MADAPATPTLEMIEAEPNEAIRALAVRYFRRRARAHLAGVHVRGLEILEEWNLDRGRKDPLIIMANHSSWWDAVMPILLSLDTCDHDAFGVMEHRQLVRFGFFSRVGMFSIERDNPRSALRSIAYGAELLRNTGRVLWYYPQGEIVPNDRRPIAVAQGAARLVAATAPVTLLPVAFRYEMLGDERPDVFVRVGPPQVIASEGEPVPELRRRCHRLISEGLTSTVDIVREEVISGDTKEYRTILEGRRSIDRWWDDLRGIEKE